MRWDTQMKVLVRVAMRLLLSLRQPGPCHSLDIELKQTHQACYAPRHVQSTAAAVLDPFTSSLGTVDCEDTSCC